MKKIYIIPTTTTVAVNVVSTILEGPLQEFNNTTVSGNRGGWAKEDRDRGSRQDYNVWKNDWSQ